MRLYLVRHGMALSTVEDAKRSLSKQGITDTHIIGTLLQQNDITVAQLYHSGKERALQTANILADYVGTPNVSALIGLMPDDPVHAVATYCNHWTEDMMLVGHLPFMAKLAAELLAQHEYKPLINFETSAVLLLERMELYHWCVQWLITPTLLQKTNAI